MYMISPLNRTGKALLQSMCNRKPIYILPAPWSNSKSRPIPRSPRWAGPYGLQTMGGWLCHGLCEDGQAKPCLQLPVDRVRNVHRGSQDCKSTKFMAAERHAYDLKTSVSLVNFNSSWTRGETCSKSSLH